MTEELTARLTLLRSALRGIAGDSSVDTIKAARSVALRALSDDEDATRRAEPRRAMTADDLRHLAEQAKDADPMGGFTSARAEFRRRATPQTILDLIYSDDFNRREAEALERRVVALEEGLRAQRPDDSVDCWCRWPLAQPDDHSPHCRQARALLASGSGEPEVERSDTVRTIERARLMEVSLHADGTVGSGYIIDAADSGEGTER